MIIRSDYFINSFNIEDIIKKYKEGLSLDKLGKLYKTRSINIREILINNNISIRGRGIQVNKDNYSNNKYNFNKDYFNTIEDELKAYWLGFLYADGNVYINHGINGNTKGATVEISLKEEDDYHLYNFRSDINGNMPITYRDIKLNNKLYPSCRISIGSIKMAKDLINHGCIPNKSLILKFPKNLSEELLPHFIRGYIDGDGCVFFNVYEKTSTFAVSLLGTYNFLNSLKYILINNNIKSSEVKSSKSKAFVLYMHGRDNLVKLYNYLYKDASRFLGRKIDKFRKALFYYDKEFKISETAKLMYLLDDELQELKFDKWYKKSNMYKVLQEHKKQQKQIS